MLDLGNGFIIFQIMKVTGISPILLYLIVLDVGSSVLLMIYH